MPVRRTCSQASRLIGSFLLCLLASCTDPAPPAGVALIRISEVAGACPISKSFEGYTDIPTDLPYRRAKATASFRASERFPGGHFIAIGYQDDDGRVGLIQFEVAPDRGYGIAEYPNPLYTQAAGFAEWQDGALAFAGTSVAGYFNYFSASDGSPRPGKIYSLVAFDARDANDAPICRIVAVHASAERARVTPFDPSWLVPRPGLLITAQDGMLAPPALDDLTSPSAELVAPAEAPDDPGAPPPGMERHAPAMFAHGWGSSSPCD